MKSLIDYYGDSVDTESIENITFQGTKEYWMKVVEKESGRKYQWSMKDQTLLSRLMKEYKTESIVPMIDFCLSRSSEMSFGHFFKERVNYYYQTHKPDNYGFD